MVGKLDIFRFGHFVAVAGGSLSLEGVINLSGDFGDYAHWFYSYFGPRPRTAFRSSLQTGAMRVGREAWSPAAYSTGVIPSRSVGILILAPRCLTMKTRSGP